ncbi:hypothetical protein NC653_000045 [Populus alba x Populus x berolinensis]|uniref:Uncharacterized protein n=1 Tax=Populus alba x Populus x berolinensis TaxID=444605 RepID=A0AAD6RIX3_9ROSI|nr:hypothetical protein NC653_000045 [Populus alba x Populus x berolinensis]
MEGRCIEIPLFRDLILLSEQKICNQSASSVGLPMRFLYRIDLKTLWFSRFQVFFPTALMLNLCPSCENLWPS